MLQPLLLRAGSSVSDETSEDCHSSLASPSPAPQPRVGAVFNRDGLVRTTCLALALRSPRLIFLRMAEDRGIEYRAPCGVAADPEDVNIILSCKGVTLPKGLTVQDIGGVCWS